MRTLLAVVIMTLTATLPTESARAQEASLEGALYLYHTRPFGEDAPPPRTEVYSAILTADVTTPRLRIHAQLRARDQLLRSFYPGTIWLQQAWASYDMAPRDSASLMTVRAGKIDQALGLVWDGSFSGNIHYFDALKRNPSFGLEAGGGARIDGLDLAYTLQYMLDSDPISGAIPGRDFSTIDGFRNRDDVFGRITVTLPETLPITARVGLSAAARGVAVRRELEEEVYHVPHLGADIEVNTGSVVAYVEWLRREEGELPRDLRFSIPGSDAAYWLAGARFHRGAFTARYNYSRARYSTIDRDDWIHQPGVGYDLHRHLHALGEVNVWRFREGTAEDVFARSVNLVLLLRF